MITINVGITCLAIIFMITSASELPKLAPGIYPQFQQYVQIYQKIYSPKQFSQRLNVYLVNINAIKQHNLDQSNQDRWAVNNFTDWKQQQLRSTYNFPSELLHNQKGTVSNKIFKKTTNLRRLVADNLNWATLGAVTYIKNQGSCGDCWVFSTVATAESFAIINGKANTSIALSPQYSLMCTSGSTCSGGIIQDASALMAQKGCPSLSSYPYDPTNTSTSICKDTSNNLIFASSRNAYQNMNNDADIIALLQTSPVAVTISSKNWISYSSGIYSCPSTAVIDHAVELVGYTSTYWILKNQWGSSWGQNGFIWVTRSRAQNTTNCFIGSTVVQYSLSKTNWMSSLFYLECLIICLFLIA